MLSSTLNRLTQRSLVQSRPQTFFRPIMCMPRMMFSAPVTEQSDDISQVPRFSLDAFYSDVKAVELTDETALEYMMFASKLAMVSFKDDAEMLSFKGDFQAALTFIGKLDEVDTKGTEPLGNVLEHYGGNDTMVRTEEGIWNDPDDQVSGVDFKEELKKLNGHYKDGYVVFNKSRVFNPDSE